MQQMVAKRKQNMSNARRRQQGGVTLEAALVLLPAIFMIYGLFEFAFVFMVGIALQSAAQEAARAAMVPAGKTVETIRDAARDGLNLDFARNCVSLTVAEYDGTNVPDALTLLGQDANAFHTENAFDGASRRLISDTAPLMQGSAKLAAFTVSCNWHTPFLTEFFGGGVQFRSYSVVAYES